MTATMLPESLCVGDRIWFAEEKRPYTVQARSARYLVCTKPFAVQHTVLYSIVDLVECERGPENLVFGMGAETREQCEEMIDRLEGKGRDWATEISHRNCIPLAVRRTQRAPEVAVGSVVLAVDPSRSSPKKAGPDA